MDECPKCVEVEDDDDNAFEEIESRNIEIDFGTVEIFKQRTEYITFMRAYIDVSM